MHPHIARVLDYHEQEGCWYLVMEYLDRGSLLDRLQTAGPIETDQALAWTCEALSGLGYAHQKGVIHRDVKPENLLLDEHEHVKIADFGIARDLRLSRLTQSGMTMGTPHYMSPEQLLNPGDVDHRADIYALGVVCYELLAGRPPFEGSSFFTISRAKLESEPLPLTELNSSISPSLERAVARAMTRNRDARFQTCEEFLASLRQDITKPYAEGAQDTTLRLQTSGDTLVAEPVLGRRSDRGAPWKSALWGLGAIGFAAFVVAWWLFGSATKSARADFSEVLREAYAARGAADLAERTADAIDVLTAEAEAETQKALAGTAASDGMERVAAASALLEQARRRIGALREAATRSENAQLAAEKAARDEGLDFALDPSKEPKLVELLPREDEAAQQAARDALEVARLERTRARLVQTDTEQSIDRVVAIIAETRSSLESRRRALVEQRQQPPNPDQKLSSAAGSTANSTERGAGSRSGMGPAGPESGSIVDRARGSEPPERPVIAVLAQGDPVLAGSFEQELERRLARAQLDVRDEQNSLAVRELMRRPLPPGARDLAPELVEAGFHVLVLIEVEEAERRHFEVRGQRGHGVAARLRINAYDLWTQEAIGAGWSEIVEYTELSAKAKAKRALLKETSELAIAIREAWELARAA